MDDAKLKPQVYQLAIAAKQITPEGSGFKQ